MKGTIFEFQSSAELNIGDIYENPTKNNKYFGPNNDFVLIIEKTFSPKSDRVKWMYKAIPLDDTFFNQISQIMREHRLKKLLR